MTTEPDPEFTEVVKLSNELHEKDEILIKEAEENQSLYPDRQAVFDAAHLILDATDCYDDDTKVKKWAIVLSAHKLNGNGKTPKPTKARFNLTEKDLSDATARADRLVLAIKAKESLALEAERNHAAWVMENTPKIPDEITVKAHRLINHPKEYLETVIEDYKKIHYGDESVCYMALRQQAIQCCPRADGLHIKMAGSTGQGKSHAIMAAYMQSPPEYVQIISSSPMGVIYDPELRERTVIMLDDCIPDQPVVDIIKQAVTMWRDGLKRNTVVSGGESKKIRLPPCISWTITACEDVKDEQFQNRFETLHIANNAEKSRVVGEYVVSESEKEQPSIEPTEERLVIQEVMRILKSMTFNPILDPGHLKVLRPKEMRSVKQLIDNMRANAILNYKERNPVTNEDGSITITVTKQDFDACIGEFQDTNVYENKLNKCEQGVLEALIKSSFPLSQADLVKKTGFNPGSIHVALVGRKGDTKAATLVERGLISEVSESEGEKTRKTIKRYESTVGPDYLTNHMAICEWLDFDSYCVWYGFIELF